MKHSTEHKNDTELSVDDESIAFRAGDAVHC